MEEGERNDAPKKKWSIRISKGLILPGNPSKANRNCKKIPVLLFLIGEY